MKAIKRWRYYCEYCGKSGGHKYWMEKHEKSCTANPNRTCGFCGHADLDPDHKKLDRIVTKAVKEFTNLLDLWAKTRVHIDQDLDILNKRTNEELIKAAENCPACVLAALKRNPESHYIEFDYQAAKKRFWELHPRENQYEDFVIEYE